MNTTTRVTFLVCVAALPAAAHVGVVNTQSALAIAGKSYELVLTIPHGCTGPDGATKLDTSTIEVAIPTGTDGLAQMTGVRPIMDGVFGKAEIVSRDTQGNVTRIRWSKPASLDGDGDVYSYRVGLRGTMPNLPFSSMQFLATQRCRNGAAAEVVKEWGAESPIVKVFPAHLPGWNKFNLSVGLEKHSKADVQGFLSGFFGDALIVWVGKGAWSPNATTQSQIASMIEKDASFFDLFGSDMAMIHSTDDIWVRY